MAGLNLFTNNAATTLASGITNSATSLTVASGTGATFPNPTGGQYFYCTLQGASGSPIEIIKVTARSTDTFTIVRAQDNTTASAFSTNDKVELRATAADLNNFGQLDSTNTWASAQTFSAAPIFSTLTGLLYGNGASASTVATAAQIVSAIGSTAVTNATNATTAGSVTNALTIGTGLSGTSYNGGSAVTINATGTTINSQTAAYTLVASDAGKTISITTGGVTVPNSVLAAGNIVTIYNNSASSQTITQGTGVTLQWAGQASSTTGNRTLGLYGVATLVFITASNAVISGAGLS